MKCELTKEWAAVADDDSLSCRFSAKDDDTKEHAEGNALSTKLVEAYNSSHDGFAVVSEALHVVTTGEDDATLGDARKSGSACAVSAASGRSPSLSSTVMDGTIELFLFLWV